MDREGGVMKLLLCLILGLSALVSRGENLLFEHGKTDWKIYLPEKASETEEYAAKELAEYLQKVSQCRFQMVRGGTVPDSKALVLGTPETQQRIRQLETQLKLNPGKEQSFALYSLGGNLYFAGCDSRGVLYAVYTFLQECLGIRWFWPSTEPDGEFVPALRKYEIPALAVNREPAIRYRGYHFLNGTNPKLETWLARNYGNIIRHGVAGGRKSMAERMRKGIYIHTSGHNIVLPDKELLKKRPELFALAGGKRTLDQLCWNNREVDDLMFQKFVRLMEQSPEVSILGFYPEDNQNYCACKECGKKDISTNWFSFLRRLTDRLHARYPSLRFTSIAYQGYIDYPKCDMKGYEYIEYAPYGRCFVHGMDVSCPVNDHSLKSWNPWLKSGIPTGVYGYEFDVLRPVVFIPAYHLISEQMRFFKKNNVQAVLPEVDGTYQGKGMGGHSRIQMRLVFYLYTRLMWNPDADVNGLIRDFCGHVWPSAAGELAEYHAMMGDAWNSQKQHFTGYFNSPITAAKEFMTPERIARAFELFRRASERIAANPDANIRARELRELEYEKNQFSAWVKYYWQNVDHVWNVPLEKPSVLSLKYGSRIRTVWNAKGISLTFEAPDADQATVVMTEPNGKSLSRTIPLTDGKGRWTAEDALKASDCRQLRVTFRRGSRIVDSIGIAEPYVLYCSRRESAGKKALIAIPPAEIPKRNIPKVRSALMDAGWQIQKTDTPAKLQETDLKAFDVVAVRLNDNPVDASFYSTRLLPYVANGGLAILSVDSPVALESLFGRPEFRLKWTGHQEYFWKLRKTQQMKDGDWRTKPDDLEKALKMYCTPYSGYEIPVGSRWQMLASMRKKDGSAAPYLLEMPWGKGRIILTTGPIGLDRDGQWMTFGSSHQDSVTALFNNMLEYNRR